MRVFSEMVRVVVTTTTIPTRENSVQKMIQSLKSGTLQPDAIYVNLPDWYPRFKCGPDSNLEPKLVSMGVTVNKCKDYGVLTKLLPTLELEKDPETLLVILDDDMIYQPRFLEGLVKGMMSSSVQWDTQDCLPRDDHAYVGTPRVLPVPGTRTGN